MRSKARTKNEDKKTCEVAPSDSSFAFSKTEFHSAKKSTIGAADEAAAFGEVLEMRAEDNFRARWKERQECLNCIFDFWIITFDGAVPWRPDKIWASL